MVATTTLRALGRGFIPGATLGLHFVEQRAVLNAAEQPLAPLLSVARPSAALGVGAAGVVQSFGANAPRLVRRSVNGRMHGLLCEGAGAQFLLYPRNLTQAPWTRTGTGATSSGVLGVDGANLASRCQDTVSVGSTPANWSQSVTITNDTYPVTFAVDLRYVSMRYIKIALALSGGTGVSGYAIIDLLACQVIASSGVAAYCDPAPLGFNRAQITLYNNGLGNTSATATISRSSSSDSPGYVDVDFANIMREGRASSRIYNTSAAGSRAADTVTLNTALAPLSSWYSQGGGTIFIEADLEGAASDYTLFALWYDYNNIIWAYRQQITNAIIVQVVTGGTAATLTLYGADAPGFVRIAMSYFSTLVTVAARVTSASYTARRSGVQTLTLSASLPSPNALHLGHSNGGSALQGVLRQLAYSPVILTASNLSDVVE